MKKLLLILFTIVSVSVQAQYLKPNNSYGTISNRQSIDSTLLIPTGCGDPSLRGVDLKKVALYADTCNNLLYKYNPVTTTWSVIGSNTTLADGLVSGGIVTWSGTGLKFYVSPAIYILGSKYYYSNLDSVTLAAAPTSNSRIDLIGVDTSRHAFVDTGVVSATPIVPQAQVGVQIPLTTGILINAGDTIPSNVIVTMVYNENLGEPDEWSTHTENAPITADFNNTTNPKKGTKDIFISRYNSQSIVYFATSTPYTLSSDAALSGWVYLNKRLVNTIYAFLYNSTTGAKTNAIPLSLDNFDSTSYQQFVLPTSNFTWTGNTNNQFNTLEFYFSGYDTTDLKGLRFDWITLQKGIQSVPPQIDYSNKLDSVLLSNDSLFQYVKGVKTFKGLATGSSSGSDSSAYSSAASVNDSTWSLNAKNGTKTFFQLTQGTTGIVGDTVKFTNPNFVKKSDKFPIGTIKPILALNDSTLAFDSLNLTEIRYSLAVRDTTKWTNTTLIDRKFLDARVNPVIASVNTNTTAIASKADKATTLTINGVTQDLSTNRTWTVSSGDSIISFSKNSTRDSTILVLRDGRRLAVRDSTGIWNLSGSAAYYNSGHVLIGTSSDDGHTLRVNGTVSLNLGSDAPGDTYYRDSLGTFSRLAAPTGFTKPVLGFANGYPKWQQDSTGGGGGGTATNFYADTITTAGGNVNWLATISGIASYSKGLTVYIPFSTGCGASPTLNINSLGAIPLMYKATAPATNEITSGMTLELVYNGTNFQILNYEYPVIPKTTVGNNWTVNQYMPGGIVSLDKLETYPSQAFRGNIWMPTGSAVGSTTWSDFLENGNNLFFRTAFNGNSGTVTGGYDFANVIFGRSAVNIGTGTHALWSNISVLTPTPGGSGTVNDAQAAYFGNAPTFGTRNWSINAGASRFRGKLTFDSTTTALGTDGNQTINKPSGTVNIAASGTTVTVTNSLVTATSIVYAVIRTNDATAYIKNVVPAAGSFVITLGAAATAEISIGFIVFN